ncbi:2184_t:CDS:1, partial [Ambispora leptoticha]
EQHEKKLEKQRTENLNKWRKDKQVKKNRKMIQDLAEKFKYKTKEMFRKLARKKKENQKQLIKTEAKKTIGKDIERIKIEKVLERINMETQHNIIRTKQNMVYEEILDTGSIEKIQKLQRVLKKLRKKQEDWDFIIGSNNKIEKILKNLEPSTKGKTAK